MIWDATVVIMKSMLCVAVDIWDRQLWHLIPNRLEVQELKLD